MSSAKRGEPSQLSVHNLFSGNPQADDNLRDSRRVPNQHRVREQAQVARLVHSQRDVVWHSSQPGREAEPDRAKA